MGYPDIERAREGQAALRGIIDRTVAPGANARALRRVLDLCRSIVDAVDDEYCRVKVHAVAEYAAELLSQAEPRARGAIPGVDYLREQIRGALELLQSRLYSLERARRYGQLARAAYGPAQAAFKR